MSLAQAISLHQRGDLAAAEAAYRKILGQNSACHEALHGLGLIMHQRGQHELAVSLIEHALKLEPAQADYHYHLAEALRSAGRHVDAVDRYREAIQMQPTEADYYFGLGNALADQQSTGESIEAYRKAVGLAPNDAEIQNNLGNLLADQGQVSQALVHLRKAVSLSPDYVDAHHNLALVLKETGQLQAALEHARKASRLAPRRAEPLINLGQLLAQSGDPKGAISCLHQALEHARNQPGLLARTADALREAGEPGTALQGYRRAAELEPTVARHHTNISHCLIRLNRFGEASDAARKALELDPESAAAHSVSATCLQVRGQFDRAATMLRRALALQPSFTDAAYMLATNGAKDVSDEEFRRWIALKDDPELGDDKLIHLYFALAKVYEQREEYEAAFEHFEEANSIKSRRYPFDAKRHTEYVNRIISVFNEEFFARCGKFGLDDQRPVFIVGMPRSGSTLVEQIIASHPQVAAIGEHSEMLDMVRELPALINSDQPAPECCLELNREQSAELARRYLDSLPEEAVQAARVCDKMLGNFLRLGLIALLFPGARVVHCTRNPLDICMSCFTQNFDRGLRFTTDLSNLADFYCSYRKLMAHWQDTLPTAIKEINYETLVSEPDTTTRSLIEFCDLPWDDRCLSPHETRREVATASFWQARQPIYRTSVERWRHYEKFLGPFIAGLQRGGYAE